MGARLARLWSRARAWYASLSRALQWAVLGGIGLLADFLVVEPVLGVYDDVRGSVVVREGRLREAQSRARRLESDATELERGLTRHGDVEIGEEPGPWSVALNSEIESILAESDVSNVTRNERPSEAVRRSDVVEATGGGGTLFRLVVDVQFEADPETALRTLARLEASPIIVAVNRVSMQELAGRGGDVRVSLEPEAWALSRRGARR